MASARTVVLLLALTSALALAATGAAGAGGSGAPVAAKPAASSGGQAAPSPQLALQRALSIFAPARVDARYRKAVADVDARETTMVLRDLVAQKSKLSASDRRLAERLLARPTDGPGAEGPAGYGDAALASKKRFCNTRFCIHWVRVGSERPSLRDNHPNNNRPDYVDKTIANMRTTWNKEIGAYDYKKPLGDRRSGRHHGGNPNKKIDIFIANIGNAGIYGYCTTDDPRARPNGHRQNSAYCVIDNDFRRAEFQSGAKGNKANKVTLAHEFFHAIQFRYDTFDNRAMMEGTATWMEDQVFDTINDNRQYLATSPLGDLPWAPLDLFATSGPFANWQYGTWIWYRFLSENVGPGANFPTIVRRIWNQAVGSARNGFGAIGPALATRSTTVFAQMETFGEWNAAPRAAGHYSEGVAQNYPTARVTTLPGDPALVPNAVAQVTFEMLRRSNDYFKLRPASNVLAGATLVFSNVVVPTTAGEINAIVFNKDGTRDAPVEVVDSASVPFAFANVSRVIFVFTNASGSSFLLPDDPTFDFDATVTP